MKGIYKAAVIGAGVYATMKVGEFIGFWKGTFRTAMLYGKDKAWGHRMVDKYADLYDKENKEA